MTVLEGNQAYRAAMTILKDARMAACSDNNDAVHLLLIHSSNHLTAQETKDMKASFPTSNSSPMPKQSYYDHATGTFKLQEPWGYDPLTGEWLPGNCELCGHTAREHADRYGCEHDRGDVQVQEVGAVAMGPCGCKTFVPEQSYSGQLIVGLIDLVDEVERQVGA